MRELIRREVRGIVHVGPEGHASLAEIIREVVMLLFDKEGESCASFIHEVDPLAMPLPCERPCFNVLDNTRFKTYTGLSVATWKDLLREYMRVAYHDRVE